MSDMSMQLPSPDPERIARDYAPQFEASQMLLTAIWESLPRRGRSEFELTLMNVLGRSIGTYRAVIHLLRGGFSDQAWMLNRPLFEDMVFGYWIALPGNRATARELVSEHVEEANARTDQLVKRLRRSGFAGLAERGDRESERVGRSPLVGRLNEKVEQIKDLWTASGGSLDELYVHREVTHWMSNLALHTSGLALQDALGRSAVRVEGAPLFGYGQSTIVDEQRMLDCFEFAAFRIGWLARLVLIEADRPLGELEAAYDELSRVVHDLSPSTASEGRPQRPVLVRLG